MGRGSAYFVLSANNRSLRKNKPSPFILFIEQISQKVFIQNELLYMFHFYIIQKKYVDLKASKIKGWEHLCSTPKGLFLTQNRPKWRKKYVDLRESFWKNGKMPEKPATMRVVAILVKMRSTDFLSKKRLISRKMGCMIWETADKYCCCTLPIRIC